MDAWRCRLDLAFSAFVVCDLFRISSFGFRISKCFPGGRNVMMDRMTRYALLVATAMVFVWSASAQIVEPRVAEVQISPADGPALVGLARGAMAEFLVNRTPVEKQTIPDSLAHLEHEQRTYAASVTLRHEGRPVGRAIKSISLKNERGAIVPASVCRNVTLAA